MKLSQARQEPGVLCSQVAEQDACTCVQILRFHRDVTNVTEWPLTGAIAGKYSSDYCVFQG